MGRWLALGLVRRRRGRADRGDDQDASGAQLSTESVRRAVDDSGDAVGKPFALKALHHIGEFVTGALPVIRPLPA